MTETYTRDSDKKKFRVARRLSLQNLALVIEPIEENPMPEIRLGDWIGHVDEYGLWREGVICYMKENRIDFADKNQINICFLRNGIRTIRRAGQELWEAKK